MCLGLPQLIPIFFVCGDVEHQESNKFSNHYGKEPNTDKKATHTLHIHDTPLTLRKALLKMM